MLNRVECIKQLHQVVDLLFPVKSKEIERLLYHWGHLSSDIDIQCVMQAALRMHNKVTWHSVLDVKSCGPRTDAYTVIAVDGSQIYPDKHQGFDCFLLNIACVEINYRLRNARVQLASQPHIFAPTGQRIAHTNVEQINALRYCYELRQLYQIYGMVLVDQPPTVPLVALFDGTLLLWHLQRVSNMDKQYHQALHLSLLLQEQRTCYAGYISSPRSNELVQMLQWYSQQILKSPIEINYCVDADVCAQILQPGQVTNWFFCPNDAQKNSAPDAFQVCFAYIHVGDEIARIEAPVWLAMDSSLSDSLFSVILSQVEKGGGYPVSLAEAHEQAVIKGSDRDFFYTQLWQAVEQRNLRPLLSQKSIKKRVRGI